MNRSEIIAKAQRFVSTGELDDPTPWVFEDAMLELAKANADEGEHELSALQRLAQTDDVMKALARAAHHAEVRLASLTSGEKLALAKRRFG